MTFFPVLYCKSDLPLQACQMSHSFLSRQPHNVKAISLCATENNKNLELMRKKKEEKKKKKAM